MTKLKSMDVTIGGVTRSYEFDPAIAVSSDDEGEASLEVLRDAETTEVVLTKGISSARVEVSFTVRYEGSVTVDLEDLEEVEDSDGVAENANDSFAYEGSVYDAIMESLENIDSTCISVDDVDVEAMFDDDGDEVED